MAVPVTLFYWLMSIISILLLITLMGGCFWGAAKAAPVTLFVTILIGLLVFKGSPFLIGLELLKSVWSSFSIILVIFTALLLYEVLKEAAAFQVLSHLIEEVAPNELIRIQLVGVVFASFLQGVSGFGVPVLITAPLLMRIGVEPIWAVMIPLIGHGWAGTNGTMALAWNAMIQQLEVDHSAFSSAASLYSAFFLLLLMVAANVYIAYLYGGGKGIMKGLPSIFLITLLHGGGQVALVGVYPELAVFLPSALSLVGLLMLSKSPLYNKHWSDATSKIMKRTPTPRIATQEDKMVGGASIFQSLFPYGAIIILALPVLLIKPLNEWLSSISIGPAFRETRTGLGFVNPAIAQYAPFVPFKHASFFLFLVSLFTYWYYNQKRLFANRDTGRLLLRRAIRKSLSPSIAILSLLGIARVMSGTGQTVVLAEGMAAVLKESYLLVSPLLGVVGSFLTGGNMSSNILFGNLQLYSAQIVGADLATVIGGQTAGGSLGMIIAPNILALGTGVTGLLGKEGRIILKLLPFVVGVALLMGVVLYIGNLFIGSH